MRNPPLGQVLRYLSKDAWGSVKQSAYWKPGLTLPILILGASFIWIFLGWDKTKDHIIFVILSTICPSLVYVGVLWVIHFFGAIRRLDSTKVPRSMWDEISILQRIKGSDIEEESGLISEQSKSTDPVR